MRPSDLSRPAHPFSDRHLGSTPDEVTEMLATLGLENLEDLADAVVPESIRRRSPLELPEAASEKEALAALRRHAAGNQVWRSYIGMGYHDTVTPPVIRRNVLENPGWYTQYTPYQAEISQGRLEALLNFQTLITELTGLPLANASMLDEATAAAEAMSMCHAAHRGKRSRFVVSDDVHPQILGVVRTRAGALGIAVEVADVEALSNGTEAIGEDAFGVLLQFPGSSGRVVDPRPVIERSAEVGARVVVASDPLALCLLEGPGTLGASVVVGSTQRFGVPLGFGGPHAAYLACATDLERHLPGRIVGVSKDVHGHPGLRLARQTREQHIRREKATSNICTAQVLLAVMAGFFAVYHGPEGLRRLARRVHGAARLLAAELRRLDIELPAEPFFDTLRISLDAEVTDRVVEAAARRRINLRRFDDGALGIALDETVSETDIHDLAEAFAEGVGRTRASEPVEVGADPELPAELLRRGEFLPQEVFHRYHTEHEMLRYLRRLESRDLSLVHSMIPLGSCTMKLNATAEMLPITWPEWASIHPYAPRDQVLGYEALFGELRSWLGEITGLPEVSLQPNAGSQGEYAGLLAIRGYHASRGEERDVCLIPTSAHGTNPASAVLAGLRVVPVACDELGNIDLEDLEKKAAEHGDRLAALMITYPSTHGVFETTVEKVCEAVHHHGGQVYLDGANLNAQVGLCRPGDYGADVCHLNLHKTFCIPHGGGGPGMGPICAASHLGPYLPGDPLGAADSSATGPVSAAAEGSPGILPIPWMYIVMMGADGLRRASELAVLNANYMAKRLGDHYRVLYTGPTGFVAHEFILDLREFKDSAGIQVDDVAKRLMDFGFHAPTMSWPVAGTIMVEPTESESKEELDRFCDAMIHIRSEIREIEEGRADREDNPLRQAPHTAAAACADDWPHAYRREQAAFPVAWVRERKFWPAVGRIDNAWGDRNLACTCDSVEAYAAAAD